MGFKKKTNNITNFDIAIVGGGPVGIAFACGFADTKIKVAIIDKLPKKTMENPMVDGREIIGDRPTLYKNRGACRSFCANQTWY